MRAIFILNRRKVLWPKPDHPDRLLRLCNKHPSQNGNGVQILFTQTTDSVALYNVTTYSIKQHNGINTATNAHAVLKGARYQWRVQSSCVYYRPACNYVQSSQSQFSSVIFIVNAHSKTNPQNSTEWFEILKHVLQKWRSGSSCKTP